MSNVMVGGIKGFYIYFCRNIVFKAGNPATDKQQPLNPITENTGIKLPERIYELITPVSDLYPQIEVDKNLEPSTITLRGYFREIFLMLTLFNSKKLPTSWSGTGDNILADFTSRLDIDNNISIQLRLPDPSGSNHIDLFFDGGKITEYRFIGEAQDAVMEEIDIKFSEITESTQIVNIDTGFDDGSFDGDGRNGGWALWNTNLFADKRVVLLTKDVVITIGASAPAGLAMQSFKLTLPVPQAMEFVKSSFEAGIIYEEVRGPWGLECSGKLIDKTDIVEALKTLASKTKATAKLEYDETPNNKFFQFTNAVLKNIDGISIPEAGKPIDVTYIYEGAGGSDLSYSWTGNETDDPSDHIKHTDV